MTAAVDPALAARALRDALPLIAPRDQNFATSLLAWWDRRGSLTSSQLKWAVRLTEQATRPALPAPVTVPIATAGEMQAIVSLIGNGRRNLRRPAIMILRGERTARISVAGERARVPGSLDVTDGGRVGGSYAGRRQWFGRIHTDGRWEPARSLLNATATDLGAGLRALAADPVGTASAFGRLTGRCCFCNRHLTDARSTAVGYGPDCAEHYGLPWGNERHSFTADALGHIGLDTIARERAAAPAPTRPAVYVGEDGVRYPTFELVMAANVAHRRRAREPRTIFVGLDGLSYTTEPARARADQRFRSLRDAQNAVREEAAREQRATENVIRLLPPPAPPASPEEARAAGSRIERGEM